MKKLKIEKYISGQLDESFMVPLGFIRFLKGMLPRSAINAMDKSGIDLEEIIVSSTRNEPYQSTVECKEEGVIKKVVLTLIM